MDKSLMGTISMINFMDKESICILTETFIKETGSLAKPTAKEPISTTKAISIKEIGKTVSRKVPVSTHIKTEVGMKETLRMTRCTGKAFVFIIMETDMMEIGSMI